MFICRNFLHSRILAGTAFCLITACASVPTPLHVDPDAAQTLQHWDIQGRVAVRQGEQGWHADLHWHQDREHYNIRLSGPLGQGGTEVEGDTEGVTLTLADHTRWTAPDPEILLEQRLGWHLPVAGLRYWVRGLPAPGGTQSEDRDTAGRLRRLAQDGWRIDYQGYISQAGLQLPAKLDLSHNDLRVRLLIDRWEGLEP